MENDKLTETWKLQQQKPSLSNPEEIISKAKNQRRKQFIGIVVMAVTAAVLVFYASYFWSTEWNTFNLGLLLMIGSLTFRILLEFISLYKKEQQLVTLANKAFATYLKKHHNRRRIINYTITPLCFGLYCYGFTLLLPYFKAEFSSGFYTYLLLSGIFSLVVLAFIIVKDIQRENRIIKQLKGS
ncbi:hypothetical protein GCM10011414_13290 [Croceivirga lutea]|uniref:hypothetical protein n=1 Tax=Croceivirga lutea TaxID=1775167 RepID=UPI00163B4B77|nr:hypothetical protein [Croceivirga lutea]GGG45092.1 hypothetical protein GCM10011414_13290 [Croceivirga lutea]